MSTARTWRRLAAAVRTLLQAPQHAARPAARSGRSWSSASSSGPRAGRSRGATARSLRIWLWHVPAVALVLLWVAGVCGIPLWQYLLLTVLPGTSLTLVRSFAEHKAAGTPLERTALVESGPLLSLLFLNNNLHYAHHERPDLPWHALPAYYRAHRARLLRENGGLLYRGYREILRRFLLRPVDAPVAPVLLNPRAAPEDRVEHLAAEAVALAHWVGRAAGCSQPTAPGAPGVAGWRPLQGLERAERRATPGRRGSRAAFAARAGHRSGRDRNRSGATAAERRRPDPRAAPRRARDRRAPPGRPASTAAASAVALAGAAGMALAVSMARRSRALPLRRGAWNGRTR